jgi:hypothetical protein
MPAHRFALGSAAHVPAPLGEPTPFMANLIAKGAKPADCWDQATKFGFFRKGDLYGIPRDSDFTLATQAEALDNFAAEVDPGWADFNHDAGEACAYYDAAALMVGGQCLRMVTKRGFAAPPPPSRQDVTHPTTGDLLDGIFWHRFAVTQRGQALLPNVASISPAFDVEGRDEQFGPIGFDIFNIAWCSGPFLDGMKPLEMTRFSKRGHMDNEYLKKFGLSSDEGIPDGIKAAMKKYAEEVDAEKAKMAADHDAAMKKYAEKDEDEPKEKEAMTALRSKLNLPADARPSAILQAFSARTAPLSDVAAIRAELETFRARDAEREAASKKTAAQAFARRAVEEGRTAADKADIIEEAYIEKGEAHAERLLFAKGAMGALKTYTRDGHPDGNPGKPPTKYGDVPAIGEELVAAARVLMSRDPKLTMDEAMTAAHKANPQLYTRGR